MGLKNYVSIYVCHQLDFIVECGVGEHHRCDAGGEEEQSGDGFTPDQQFGDPDETDPTRCRQRDGGQQQGKDWNYHCN